MTNQRLKITLGTTSWSWTDWIKSGFYPPGTKAGEMLPHYSRKYGFVEVDSTYYSIPSPQLCARWRTVTPEGFRFSAKVPKLFTVDKALQNCKPEWELFMKSLGEIGEKLRLLVFQFSYFNLKSPIPSLPTFLERLKVFLDKCPAPFPLALETRNPKWIGPELLDFLRERKIVLAMADQKWMPKPVALWEQYGEKLITGPMVYIRLIGDREQHDQHTEGVDRIVIDRTRDLEAIADLIDKLHSTELEVIIMANNRFEGNGPETVQRLARILEGRKYKVWDRSYPEDPKYPGLGPADITRKPDEKE